jgi:hypothetical protein
VTRELQTLSFLAIVPPWGGHSSGGIIPARGLFWIA